MKLRLRVKWKKADGSLQDIEVSTTLATIVAWERQFRRKASELGSGMGVEDVLFLAWHQISLLGLDGRPFDDWMVDAEDVEFLDAADTGPPTKPDTSGDN